MMVNPLREHALLLFYGEKASINRWLLVLNPILNRMPAS